MSARRTPAPADDRNQVTPIDPDSVVVSDRTRWWYMPDIYPGPGGLMSIRSTAGSRPFIARFSGRPCLFHACSQASSCRIPQLRNLALFYGRSIAIDAASFLGRAQACNATPFYGRGEAWRSRADFPFYGRCVAMDTVGIPDTRRFRATRANAARMFPRRASTCDRRHW